ncbi:MULTISPECIES: hypothetical protein [Clostridium]|uniref:Phage head-tail joining protein n=1 Tax=Clostridium coskatii TaxID=1705578 RepID=A0A166TTW7_9CLOT|nr:MULTISPECIES: hypothetical protein [Clostridium]OAA94087.1 hypothetical protein WX73_03657 [Clostridium coskatii]OBR96649.1 hypothetical protein CLCOS_08110 [Clostridium coskatii]QXE20447.1 hypothetical protein B5S50_17270 [Clostridium sp. 001]
MKIKTPTNFVSFSDGVCSIYSEDDDGNKNNKYENLGFTKCVLGLTRFFQADANQMKVDKVIKIPQLDNIDTYDHATIDSVDYDIMIIQDKYDTNPPSRDLTLKVR